MSPFFIIWAGILGTINQDVWVLVWKMKLSSPWRCFQSHLSWFTVLIPFWFYNILLPHYSYRKNLVSNSVMKSYSKLNFYFNLSKLSMCYTLPTFSLIYQPWTNMYFLFGQHVQCNLLSIIKLGSLSWCNHFIHTYLKQLLFAHSVHFGFIF